MSHALERTSPKGKGQKFVGRCIKCGKENLTFSDLQEICPAEGLVSDQQALLDILAQVDPDMQDPQP